MTLSGIIGTLFLLANAALALAALRRLCITRRTAKVQAAKVASDYKFQTNPDDIVHTSEGLFRVSDGEHVPLDRAA